VRVLHAQRCIYVVFLTSTLTDWGVLCNLQFRNAHSTPCDMTSNLVVPKEISKLCINTRDGLMDVIRFISVLCNALCFALFCYALPCCAPRCDLFCFIMLCHALLCSVSLCFIVLCLAKLCALHCSELIFALFICSLLCCVDYFLCKSNELISDPGLAVLSTFL
jgi:hypothetical protein